VSKWNVLCPAYMTAFARLCKGGREIKAIVAGRRRSGDMADGGDRCLMLSGQGQGVAQFGAFQPLQTGRIDPVDALQQQIAKLPTHLGPGIVRGGDGGRQIGRKIAARPHRQPELSHQRGADVAQTRHSADQIHLVAA
jgi:hypothetical protein